MRGGGEWVLAVDIGGTKTLIALFRGRDMVVLRKMKTPRRGIAEALDNEVGKLLEEEGVPRVERAGVSAPGPLDVVRGVITGSPNMGEEKVDLRIALKRHVQALIVANDAVAALWAEVAEEPGVQNAVLVALGTGIGGGVLIDGRLTWGHRGDAHEIGHIVVDHSFPHACGCGGRGHWEAIAGGRWIARTARLLAEVRGSPNTKGRSIALEGGMEAPLLFSLYEEGDDFAANVVEYLAGVHAAGIASVVSAYDPEIVFLSGGLYERVKHILKPLIQARLGEYLWRRPGPPLRDTRYGELQGLWGAFHLASHPHPGHPWVRW